VCGREEKPLWMDGMEKVVGGNKPTWTIGWDEVPLGGGGGWNHK